MPEAANMIFITCWYIDGILILGSLIVNGFINVYKCEVFLDIFCVPKCVRLFNDNRLVWEWESWLRQLWKLHKHAYLCWNVFIITRAYILAWLELWWRLNVVLKLPRRADCRLATISNSIISVRITLLEKICWGLASAPMSQDERSHPLAHWIIPNSCRCFFCTNISPLADNAPRIFHFTFFFFAFLSTPMDFREGQASIVYPTCKFNILFFCHHKI